MIKNYLTYRTHFHPQVSKLLSALVQPKGNKDCLTKDAAEHLSDFLKRECSKYKYMA